MYWRENDAGRHQSFCFVCHEAKHSASMVQEFLRRLITEMQKLIPGLSKTHCLSNGCAGHYKNELNFIYIAHHATDFGIICEWHFFVASHGKSACDDIVGTVKRPTAKQSLRRPLGCPPPQKKVFWVCRLASKYKVTWNARHILTKNNSSSLRFGPSPGPQKVSEPQSLGSKLQGWSTELIVCSFKSPWRNKQTSGEPKWFIYNTFF